MFIVGVILIFAPLLTFVGDQLGMSFPFDALTFSVITGGIGVLLLGISQRQNMRRAVIAILVSIIVLALQVYGIAALVLQQSDLAISAI